MYRNIASLIFIFSATFGAQCREIDIPKDILGKYRQKVPLCFYTSVGSGNDCEGYAYDTIAIELKSRKLVYTGIDLIFQNADRCHFYGIGRWNGKQLTASAPSNTDQMCRITISFSNGAARITGASDACGRGFCAYHGTLNFSQALPKYQPRHEKKN